MGVYFGDFGSVRACVRTSARVGAEMEAAKVDGGRQAAEETRWGRWKVTLVKNLRCGILVATLSDTHRQKYL